METVPESIVSSQNTNIYELHSLLDKTGPWSVSLHTHLSEIITNKHQNRMYSNSSRFCCKNIYNLLSFFSFLFFQHLK